MAAPASNGRYSPSRATGALTSVAAEAPTVANQSSRPDSGSGGPTRSWVRGMTLPPDRCRTPATASCPHGVDGDDLVQPGELQRPERGVPAAGADHQPGAAHPTTALGSGEHPDRGGAEERHPSQIDDQLADAGLVRLRLQADLHHGNGVAVDLADDLDDDPAGTGSGHGTDRQQPAGVGDR